jgi:hypothetical protein
MIRVPPWVGAGTDVALAYAPDGSLLVAYPVYRQLRAAIVSRSGAVGRPFRLGPASEVSRVVAEIGAGGRAVVAWTTIDAGEERNERRRVYAVTREPGASAFGRAQLVDRARHLNIGSDTATAIRLAVAANGRALLMWASDHSSRLGAGYAVRVAQATPRGRFAASRQLVAIGSPGDVAIRDDGTALAVFLDSQDALRAVVHRPQASFGATESVASPDRIGAATAAFEPDGHPHVEWRARVGTEVSTRDAP